MCHIALALLSAVKDSVVEVMAGVVAYGSQIGIEITNQTLVLYSSFIDYSSDTSELGLNLASSPDVLSLMEELLKPFISLLLE